MVDSTTQVSPSDEEIITFLRALRLLNPEIGRAKVLAQLTTENGWTISDTRLKKLMAKHELKSSVRGKAEDELRKQKTHPNTQEDDPTPDPGRPIYPQHALAAQQRYKKHSTRCFRLYGRGQYDYGVTPNASMAILIDVHHQRLVQAGRPTTPSDKELLARSSPMQTLWAFYSAAAQKAGVATEDIGRQLEAEYGVNPIPYLPPPPSAAETQAREAGFKEQSIKLLREIRKTAEGRGYVPIYADGEPVWTQETHGEFALVVVKIDQGAGLVEYGSV